MTKINCSAETGNTGKEVIVVTKDQYNWLSFMLAPYNLCVDTALKDLYCEHIIFGGFPVTYFPQLTNWVIIDFTKLSIKKPEDIKKWHEAVHKYKLAKYKKLNNLQAEDTKTEGGD